MTIPTGHVTITHEDNKRSRGRLVRGAREGDIYLDSVGNHWVCHGKQTVRFGETRTWSGPAAQMQNLPKWGGTQSWKSERWKSERGIPAGVDVKYETSYTKRIVDALLEMPFGGAHGFCRPTPIIDAVNLLKDYHRSLHAPYEQRDKARQDLVVAEAQRDQARTALNILKDRFRHRCKFIGERLIRYSKET
jgi:hypothetical protein